jgi:hypothetical protein
MAFLAGCYERTYVDIGWLILQVASPTMDEFLQEFLTSTGLPNRNIFGPMIRGVKEMMGVEGGEACAGVRQGDLMMSTLPSRVIRNFRKLINAGDESMNFDEFPVGVSG